MAFGLILLAFHRPIADFMLERERALVIAFRQRGVPLPPAPTTQVTRNLYFALGMMVVLCQILRIWTALHR
ncbi:MAG: hypothetical protein ACE14L_16005 [Terriglobales bacterium]